MRLAPLLVLAMATPALAQARGGVHPHFAPLAPGAGANVRGSSPLCNVPDGAWNHGEGFPGGAGVEGGGYLGRDDGLALTAADVRAYDPAQPWLAHDAQGVIVDRFVGYLRPASLPPIAPGGRVDDAAFEVFAPRNWNANADTVIVISSWSTFGGRRPQDGGDFAYPGTTPEGLRAVDVGHDPDLILRPEPNSDWLAARSHRPGLPYNLVCAYVVPRIAGQPLLFHVQRNLQLVEAVRFLLADPARKPPAAAPIPRTTPTRTPVVVAGESFGGLVALLSTLLYPDRCHGSVGYEFSGSLRRVMGDQAMYTMITSLCGFGAGGDGYSLRAALDWPAFLRQVGADYLEASFTAALAAGRVTRPHYFVVSDEDMVTHGTDWLPAITGVRAAWSFGARVANPATGARVHWSLIDKRGHFGGPFTLSNGQPARDSDDATALLIPDAVAAWRNHPVVPASDREAALAEAPEDPQGWFLARGPTLSARPPTGAKPGLLVASPSFARRGHGTWLGHDESLAVSGRDVFTGSADGVVTRFRVNATTRVVEAQAESPPLGHGAWGIAVGDVGTRTPGQDEVVATTHAGIAVLDGQSLAVLAARAFDRFEHRRPRRVRVVDVFANPPGNEIVLTTVHGHLLVLDERLAVLADWPEPGIVDVIVDPATTLPKATTASRHPVYLLSARGRVATVTLDLPANGARWPAELHAASEPLVGDPLDLEPVRTPQGLALAALFGATGKAETIRVFDPVTLARTDVATDVGNRKFAGGRIADLAVTYRQGLPYFVVLKEGSLHLVDSNGAALGHKDLTTFAPAVNPLALAVGDVFDDPQSLFADEVVVSTEGGHVVWFEVDRLWQTIVPGKPQALGLARSPGGADAHTNASLAATWGFAAKDGALEVADQTGTRWRVDARTGAPTWRHELRFDLGASSLLVASPIRDLVEVGSGYPSVANPPPAFSFTNLPPGAASAPNTALWSTYPNVPLQLGIHVAVHWTDFWPAVLHAQPQFDGWLALQGGGDRYPAAAGNGDFAAYWWTGLFESGYHNLVQGGSYRRLPQPAVRGAYKSIATGTHKPPFLDLRGETGIASCADLQALRIGVFGPGLGPFLALGTSGGRALLVDPGFGDHGRIVAQSDDFGFGGMALALGDLDGDGFPELAFGTTVHHARPDGGPLTASVHVLSWDGASRLAEIARLTFDDPPEFGVAGLAFAEVDPASAGPELVVTTLTGTLMVWATASPGRLLFRQELTGALGAYGAILADDLDGDRRPELYVAGSRGIRRFDVVP